MGLTRLSLKRPVSVVIIIAAIVIFGISSIFGLNMQLAPDMEMPMFIVFTTYIGVSPEDIDELVSQEIEEAGGTLKGLKNIQSSSSENMSMVMFQYDYGTDMDDAYMDLLEAINSSQNNLPSDAGKPTIIELNMNQLPTMMISAAAEGDIDLLNYIEDDVVPEIERITDVAEVDVSGGRDAYISVTLNQQKMNQYGLDMNTVVTYINAANFTMPVGTASHGRQSMNVSISAEYDTVDQLLAIPITTGRGAVIKLSDVADVRQQYESSNSISRYNGLDNVTISVSKRQSAGDVAVANSVRQVLNRIEADDSGVHFEIISDTSESVKSSLVSVAQTLVLGMILSMLILFIFFGDMKGSLIVGCSMPISVLITFILMKFMGYSLNVVTMGGLVIGVGMMVDNSIVVLESCFRKRDEGLGFMEAADAGTKFVLNSIVASTTTTIAVFLPISLTKGLSGQMFGPLGFTIVFSLLASLVSAITLVPLFFSKYKPAEKKNTPITKFLSAFSDGYSRLLRTVLHHKKLAFFTAIALLIAAFAGATLLNMELMPQTDQGHIAFTVNGKPGLKIEQYDTFMAELETLVSKHPDMESYSLSASSANASGTLDVYLKKDREKETWETAEEWKLEMADITDFDVSIAEVSDSGMGSGGMGGENVEITLLGSSMEDLKESSAMIEELMKETPGIINVTSTANTSGSKAKLMIDPLKAASVGFTPAMVAGSVNMALSGVDTIEITNNRKLYTVKVEYPKEQYEDVADLNNLMLVSPSGKSVLLSDISDIVYTDSAQALTRYNGRYSVTITGIPMKASRFEAKDAIESAAADMLYPGDVSIGSTTMSEMMTEEFASLGSAIAVAFILVLMIMAMQFESLRFSLMVMWCVPFSLVGSIGLMLLTGTTLTMVSLMGILMLIGTVVNNGILFVDTTNQLRENMNREDALVETGRIRLRPILMTSLTTILAMVPMALGIGEGTEMMQSMGVVIIGGFVASTVLTLLLLPVFYTLMDQIRSGERHLINKAARKTKREQKKEQKEKKKRREKDLEIVEITDDDEQHE